MSQYPEVFSRCSQSRTAADPPKSAVKLRASHAQGECKEAQTSTSALTPSVDESRDAEFLADFQAYREALRPGRPRTVIKIPTPVPIAQSEALAVGGDSKTREKTHSARSWRHSLIAQLAMRNARPPRINFDNEGIRGKLIPTDSYWRQTSKSRSGSRAKSQTSARQAQSVAGRVAAERKPLTSRSPSRSRKSLSCIAVSERPASDARCECDTPGISFKDYSLGPACLPPQFSLPSAYSQAFGQVLSESERRHETLQLVSSLLQLPHSSTSAYRVTHTQSDFYVMTSGLLAPISKCCRAPLVIQLCAELGGKVMCAAWHCSSRNLFSFVLTDAEKDRLWREAEAASKAVSMQIQTGGHRSRSLRTGVLRKAVAVPTDRPRSSHRVFSPEPTPPRPSQDPHLFRLKDCITLKLQEQPNFSFQSSPIRRVLARGHRGALQSSLEELKKAWGDVEVNLC